MNLATGSLRNDDSCGAKNYTKATAAASDLFKWHIQKDEYGVVSLCLKQENGESLSYRRTV